MQDYLSLEDKEVPQSLMQKVVDGSMMIRNAFEKHLSGQQNRKLSQQVLRSATVAPFVVVKLLSKEVGLVLSQNLRTMQRQDM